MSAIRAGIGQQNDDCFSFVFRAFGDFDGHPDRRTGGNADQDAFRAADFFAGGKRIFVLDRDDFIVNPCIQDCRHEARADPLDFVRAGNAR